MPKPIRSFIRRSRHVKAARRLRRDQRGNFTVMFGLSAIVLVLFVGMGVDYLTALSFKSRWDTSADAAGLAAIQAASAYLSANAATISDPTLTNNAKAAGQAAGVKAFNANAGVTELTQGSPDPQVSLSVSGTLVTATVTYKGSVASHFGPLVGVPSVSVSGSATATTSMTTYINYFILVDNSQSMGVGATAADMTNLYNRTQSYGNASNGEPGCIFGCHVPLMYTDGSVQTYSNEYLAHYVSPKITLRIDSAITAIQDIITQAQNANNSGGNLKIAIYSMSSTPVTVANTGPYLNTVSSLTSDFTTLATAAAGIDLNNINAYWGWGDTDYTNTFSYINSAISTISQGTGYSANSPLNYIFIITDGVYDTFGGSSCSTSHNTYDHCTGPFDPSLCTPLKTKATVGVIYTTYLPVYQNNNSADGLDSNYSAMVAPFNTGNPTQIETNLQSCATSSNWYYEATDGPALINAMHTLFASTYSASRLSQ